MAVGLAVDMKCGHQTNGLRGSPARAASARQLDLIGQAGRLMQLARRKTPCMHPLSNLALAFAMSTDAFAAALAKVLRSAAEVARSAPHGRGSRSGCRPSLACDQHRRHGCLGGLF
jgi:hypothetical protein